MMNTEDDILLVDKAIGWTSFDVVAKIRGKIRAVYTAKGEKPTKRQLRVGHAGTLDPFATGLLIILLGEGCKKAGEFLKLDKTYEFTAKLGETSTTGDPEGEITSSIAVIPDSDPGSSQMSSNDFPAVIPTKAEIQSALKQFTGEITQIPPTFSAIKVDGKRAYKLAREGKEVVIPPRQVTISRLELVEYNYPYIKCVCDVSSGTYIRTLAEDIGKALNTGAYCTELRRTRIGEHHIGDAQAIDKIV